MKFKLLTICALLALQFTTLAAAQTLHNGSKEKPYRVVLVPADGGTQDGTRADFQPLFNAITRQTGQHFTLTVAQSYAAATEAMCTGVAEIGWFGAVSYLQTRSRGCAELLAVDVLDGESVYYAGIFARKDSSIATLADVKGRSVAFGDVNSTSSFTFPVAMLLDSGIRVPEDLGRVRLAGSHANSLKALEQAQVDAAAASFDSFEKAVRQGALKGGEYRVVARSIPIPNPPLAMHTQLPAAEKARLREAFNSVHKAPGISPDMIRGYGGKKVDRYDASYSEKEFTVAIEMMAKVNDALKVAVLRKAGQK
ncbi:MAG: phosphate/phosphite/phosphonate ABC transporter substrate-binding protein [Proteobacteria bacterium]|nr:phosphate/phosphite/phosphonate ABC transporter substrate-binding protein [Burkholderiales bacterium]